MNNNVVILQSDANDIIEIFRLYALATEYQKKFIENVWPSFKRKMVEKEIAEHKQYKIMIDEQVACVFAIAFDDPDIWFEKNKDKALYIHRIATNPEFRGQNFVKKITDWALAYCLSHQIDYIRMDTLAGNERLIQYYQKSGFHYLGDVQLGLSDYLPAHYQNAIMSLFEIKIADDTLH